MRHVSLAESRNLAFLRILEKDNRKSDANLHNFPLVHYHDQIGIPCCRIIHGYFIYHFFIILTHLPDCREPVGDYQCSSIFHCSV